MATDDLTLYLREFVAGDRDAWDRLLPHAYAQLRQIADRHFGRGFGKVTLEPTALVHEAFLRLFDRERVEVRHRRHFFALASKVMRDLLVDHARRRAAQQRSDGASRVTLREALAAPSGQHEVDVLDLHELLTKLEALDERQARVVELRFFAGLGNEETAAVLEVSLSTVEREWRSARAWLGLRLTSEHRNTDEQ